MAKKIKQFRYYDESSSNNSPSGLKAADIANGAAFNNYYPIIQLGIQTLPGTRFYLNGSTEYIVVGSTGIYELDVDGMTEITNLRFNASSLETIQDSSSAYLIIDIMYEGE